MRTKLCTDLTLVWVRLVNLKYLLIDDLMNTDFSPTCSRMAREALVSSIICSVKPALSLDSGNRHSLYV